MRHDGYGHGLSPALRAVLPLAEQRSAKYRNNGLERDHQHLNGRVQPMRRFKTTGGASRFCQGHALIRNRGRGHASLTKGLHHVCGWPRRGQSSPPPFEPMTLNKTAGASISPSLFD
jgi:hypothetical protein